MDIQIMNNNHPPRRARAELKKNLTRIAIWDCHCRNRARKVRHRAAFFDIADERGTDGEARGRKRAGLWILLWYFPQVVKNCRIGNHSSSWQWRNVSAHIAIVMPPSLLAFRSPRSRPSLCPRIRWGFRMAPVLGLGHASFCLHPIIVALIRCRLSQDICEFHCIRSLLEIKGGIAIKR